MSNETNQARYHAIRLLSEAAAQLADPNWCKLDEAALEAVAELAGTIRGASQTGLAGRLLAAHAALDVPIDDELLDAVFGTGPVAS